MRNIISGATPSKFTKFLHTVAASSLPLMMMIMMMMMCRFVERVLNSPQTRCQSQSNRLVLRCRANDRGESIAVRKAAGRLFQMCGLVTAKLLIPSVDVFLGTNSGPVSVSRLEILLAGDSRNWLTVVDQVKWHHPCRHSYTIMASLYLILWRTGSQWRLRSTGVMWSNFRVPVTTRAAAFWTACSFLGRPPLTP